MKTSKRENLLFFAGLILLLAFCVWKLPYGFGWYDEAFYLTLPQRFTLGDAMLVSEWHPAQLFSFLTVPFLSLWRALFPSLEGVMLGARAWYLVWHTAVAVFVYFRLRRVNGPAAVLAALSFYLFAPFDIMAQSYNSLGMGLLSVCCVGLTTADGGRSKGAARAETAFYGLCFAGAVLCCPYLLALYAIYAVVILVTAVRKGKRQPSELNQKTDGAFSAGRTGAGGVGERKERFYLSGTEGFLFFTAGAALLAAAFFVYLLSRASVSEVLRAIPMILSDPEHSGETVWQRLSAYFNHAPHGFFYGLAFYLILLAAFFAVKALKKDVKRLRPWFLGLSCLTAVYTYAFCYADLIGSYYNAIMMPLAYPGFFAYLLSEKKNRKVFRRLFLPGLGYTAAICLSSNTGFYAVSVAYAVVNLSSWMFLGELTEELLQEGKAVSGFEGKPRAFLRKAAVAGTVGTVCVLLALQVLAKARHCFYDQPPRELDTEISSGPAKGLRTTDYHAWLYDRMSEELRVLKEKEPGRILILSQKSWAYLITDPFPFATYSAWLSGMDETALSRLDAYWAMNPDSLPRYVYAERGAGLSDERLAAFAETHGLTLEETAGGFFMERAEADE